LLRDARFAPKGCLAAKNGEKKLEWIHMLGGSLATAELIWKPMN
jgi:hypothetical protein